MKDTELIFYKDQYVRDFEAEILDVRPEGELWDVILNRTCFYPEGGGQPGDRGMIGGIEVADVKKRAGIVHHLVRNKPDGMSGKVNCSIDWSRRFDYMQQHTGQHIVSAVLYKFGISTVSVHQGESYTSIETGVSVIPEEQLERIEEEVNLLISRNLKIVDFQAADNEVPDLNLRRPPKVRGKIRIVEIDGVDRVACGGVHTKTTGEVLFAKIIFTEKIRSHVRIAWKLGNRVLKDYRGKVKLVQDLSGLLSAPEEEIYQAVSRIVEENTSRKREMELFQKEAARKEADDILASAEMSGGTPVSVREFSERDSGYLKLLLSVFPADRKYAACLVNRSGDKIQWALAVTADGFDFNKARNELLSPINGKGGGRPPFYQGVGTDPDGIEEFFEVFKRVIRILDLP